jgi:HAMP domain-containing protein
MGRRERNGGLGTRIALRTFMLFCVCATLPTALFAVVGYHIVSTQLAGYARSRLEEVTKSYAVLINERLVQADATVTEFARLQLSAGAPLPAFRSLESSRVRIVDVHEESGVPGMAQAASSSAIEILPRQPFADVRLHVTVSGNGRRLHLVAEPEPAYLWDSSAVERVATTICVYAPKSVLLHCSGTEEHPGTAIDDRADRSLHAEWPLFLKPRFGVDEWIVRVQQRDGASFAAMRSLGAVLPIAAALAIVGAMLLSSVQIRRSHRPLLLLTQAADSMRRGKLDTRVRLPGRDEYAGLGRAFNRMASHLKRQFRLLSTLNRIDRLILTHPAVEPMVQSVLPHILRVLGCDAVALLLWDREDGGSRLYVVHRAARAGVESSRVSLSGEIVSKLSNTQTATLTSADIAACELPGSIQAAGLSWRASMIKVDQRARGTLLAGSVAARRSRKQTERYATELANRFAVALGNEDRDRALIKQAYYDSLTGLPNRQLFKDRLEQELARSG